MESDDKKLKLIYVLKIGYNSKYEGLFEFIFSTNTENVLIDDWCWDLLPACDKAQPPTAEYIDLVVNLKTDLFDLVCLHEAVDVPYMYGYHTIRALAYENMERDNDQDGFSQYDSMFGKDKEEDEDVPILVFHYGMSLGRVKDLLYARKIILKNNEFVEASSIKLD
jgi:hypothetical protein